MSEDGQIAPAPAPSPRGRPLWLTASWVTLPIGAVLIAIALPGWLEIAPWRIVALTPPTTVAPAVMLRSAYAPQRTVITVIAIAVGLIAATLVCVALSRLNRPTPPSASPDVESTDRARFVVRTLALANAVLLAGGVASALYLHDSARYVGWRHVVGYNFANYPAHFALYILEAFSPQTWSEATVSNQTTWAVVGGVVLVTVIAATGYARLRLTRARASKFVPFGAAASVMALVVAGVEISQLRTVSQYLLARLPGHYFFQISPYMTKSAHLDHFSASNEIFVHSGYGAVTVAFGLFVIAELVVLAALLFYVTVLAARRRVSSSNAVPVLIVRNLTIVVAVTVVAGTIVGQLAT